MKSAYFGGILDPQDMFFDDLWWSLEKKISIRRIEVKPNPMFLKAEQIFRDALKK